MIAAMSRNVTVVITDDLDGSADAAPVTFSLDGVSYEIDLSARNRAGLESALAPFIAAGRKAPGPATRGAASRPGSSRADRAAVREWARRNGLKVSERGRISTQVLQRYHAEH